MKEVGNQWYVVVVVITPRLPWDGGTARTAIQVHAVSLIEINPRVAFYDMLG